MGAPVTPLAHLEAGFRVARYDGLAHITRDRGDTWSLCGVQTDRLAPARAVPCDTCLVRAAERIVDAEGAA